MAQRKSNRWAKTFHIKKGSTNEVSVSVLGAAKQKVDSEKGEAPGKTPGVVSLFTVDKSGSSSSVPSKTLAEKAGGGVDSAPLQAAKAKPGKKESKRRQEKEKRVAEKEHAPRHERPKEKKKPSFFKKEKDSRDSFEKKAEKKKAARLRRRIAAGVLIAAACAVCVGLVAIQVQEAYLQQQGKIAIVEKSLVQIEQADQVVTKLNDALSDPKSEESKKQFYELEDELPQAALSLQRAKSLVDQGIEGMREGYDREAATRAKKAIEARLVMIDQGKTLLANILAALDTAREAQSAWEILIKADGTARDAATYLLDPTEENLNSAMEGTRLALSQLENARQAFGQVTPMEDLDLSPYSSYIEKRKAALEYAQGAISALQAEDLDEARSLQDLYARADSEAVGIAAGLPSSPSSLVYELYQTQSADSISAYEMARASASSADAMLRDYYGGQHK